MNIFFSSVSGTELTAYKHFYRVLERLGHRVFFFSTPSGVADPNTGRWAEPGFPLDIHFSSLAKVAGFEPDLFIYMEPDGIIPRGIERANFPTACIISDTHLWLEPRQHLARFFDHVFLFHRNYVETFTNHPSGHVHWMPYACDIDYFYPMTVEKDFDVAFIGKLDMGKRQDLINKILGKYRINERRFYYQSEIPNIYSRAKIVLNMPLGDDLNYRTFEALSCGSMLLTKRINNGQEVLFSEGVHYAAYSDEAELIEKIDYFLGHPEQREKIATAGLAEVQRSHSLELRLKQMLETITANLDFVAPIRKLTKNQIFAEYAWLYDYWRMPEAGYRLIREARNAHQQWLPLIAPALQSTFRMIFR